VSFRIGAAWQFETTQLYQTMRPHGNALNGKLSTVRSKDDVSQLRWRILAPARGRGMPRPYTPNRRL
jgi:hypothetical protein